MAENTIGVKIESVPGVPGVPNGTDGLIQDPRNYENVKSQKEKLDDIYDVLQEIVRQKNIENNDTKRKLSFPFPLSKDDKEFKSGANGIIGIASAGTSAVTNLVNGNVPGIFSDGANTIGKSLMSKGITDDGISKGLIGLGAAGIIASLVMKGSQALGNAYGNATEGLDNLLLNYGNISDNGATNSKNALKLRKGLLNKMTDTGMEFEDFVSLTNSFAGSGISDINRAGDLARESALWARRTGLDVSQTSGVAGLVERMGGNGSDFLTNSFKAAKASGLSDNQYGEFLNGIKSAMEQGISRGFKLSADDIGKNLSYVSMLSGNNPLWQGEYGAQRYNNISNAMANNVSLQNTSSMLLYQATKNAFGGNELDVLKNMEAGQWGDPTLLTSLRESLSNAYGNDRMSQMASLKEMFGLNWSGSEQVLDIINNAKDPDEMKKEIEEVIANKENLSDETKRTNALNEINSAVVDVGRNAYVSQTALTDIGSTVAAIYNYLTKDEEKPEFSLVPKDFGNIIEEALENPNLKDHTLNLLKDNWTDRNKDNAMQPSEIADLDSIRNAILKLAEALDINTEATKKNTENELEIVEESVPTSNNWGPRYY